MLCYLHFPVSLTLYVAGWPTSCFRLVFCADLLLLLFYLNCVVAKRPYTIKLLNELRYSSICANDPSDQCAVYRKVQQTLNLPKARHTNSYQRIRYTGLTQMPLLILFDMFFFVSFHTIQIITAWYLVRVKVASRKTYTVYTMVHLLSSSHGITHSFIKIDVFLGCLYIFAEKHRQTSDESKHWVMPKERLHQCHLFVIIVHVNYFMKKKRAF